MSERDYYDILGIGRDADLAAIKKAYRRAAIRHHPDKNPGDAEAEQNFKEAAEAYAVLSEPEKRRAYDRFGRAGLGSQAAGFNQDIFTDFNDILGDLFGFGGRRRSRGPAPGRDLRYDLEIDFDEAILGLETKIQLPALEPCDRCGGQGAAEGGIETCSECGGRGQVAFQQGFFTIARACSRCAGTGKRITRPCTTCHGGGRVQTKRMLQVGIPPGVDDGTRLRLVGQGEAAARGGARGDLYVVLHVRPHEFFERQDRDIVCNVPISFSQAALGTELIVPTIDGEEQKLTVPPATQSGTRIRLKGRGVPVLNGRGRGDQYVILTVRTPRRLKEEQRRLLRELAELDDEATGEHSLFDRVKNIFN